MATVLSATGRHRPIPAEQLGLGPRHPTPQADLEILKDDNADPIDIGNVLLYTLAVDNNGPSDATGVVVVDTLVPDLEYQSATPSQGLSQLQRSHSHPDLQPGHRPFRGQCDHRAGGAPPALGTFGNTASVSGNEPDPVSGNNSSSELTTVGTAQSCIVTTDLEGGDDWGSGVGVLGDGRIVLGGHGYRPAPGGQDFAVVRYTTDLMLDGSFGTGGKAATDIAEEDLAQAMAVLSDGRVLLGGHDSVGGDRPTTISPWSATPPTAAWTPRSIPVERTAARPTPRRS